MRLGRCVASIERSLAILAHMAGSCLLLAATHSGFLVPQARSSSGTDALCCGPHFLASSPTACSGAESACRLPSGFLGAEE